MIRIFLPPEKLSDNKISITGDEARYLSLVLRAMPGDLLTIFDGTGYRYVCKVLNVHNKKEVVVEKVSKQPFSPESPINIVLAQGLPKGEKMDFIIQKSTELGVDKIIPLITERSQIRHTDKLERWRKIALSASRQCGREKIPGVEGPTSFEEFLKNTPLYPPLPRGELTGGLSDSSKGIIFSEEHKERNLKKILTSFKNIKDIILLIGPEGGFSETETKIAVEKGFISVSLGPRILRTETAPVTALSIIQYELGDISHS